ncbi:sugar transferase [Arthrobacter sp. OVS8]|nr:sugar transferase [Arthrobacter sp. OVS8]
MGAVPAPSLAGHRLPVGHPLRPGWFPGPLRGRPAVRGIVRRRQRSLDRSPPWRDVGGSPRPLPNPGPKDPGRREQRIQAGGRRQRCGFRAARRFAGGVPRPAGVGVLPGVPPAGARPPARQPFDCPPLVQRTAGPGAVPRQGDCDRAGRGCAVRAQANRPEVRRRLRNPRRVTARRAAGTTLDVDGRRVPVLSSTDDVVRTVGRCGAEAVIVAGPVPGGNQYIRELGWGLEEHQAELVLASSLTNVAGPRIHWRPVEGLPLMHVDVPRYSGAKHACKRLLDIAVAATALVLLSPVLLTLAIIVKHDSPGPVLFRQERVGKAGDPFRMLKFRSMVVNAEAALAGLGAQNQGAGVLFKMHNDPRVTRCGRWMRRFSLDELPQFWNVLTGEMSLVGPRPPLQREVGGYERHTHRRLLIKPGITGLWQVNGRSDLPWDEAVRLDLYYVENWSIMGDVIIMWRTFRAMCAPAGAY